MKISIYQIKDQKSTNSLRSLHLRQKHTYIRPTTMIQLIQFKHPSHIPFATYLFHHYLLLYICVPYINTYINIRIYFVFPHFILFSVFFAVCCNNNDIIVMMIIIIIESYLGVCVSYFLDFRFSFMQTYKIFIIFM